MATSTAARYQHLEPRPGSNYRQLFLKGRRIRAAVVYEAFHGPIRPRSSLAITACPSTTSRTACR